MQIRQQWHKCRYVLGATLNAAAQHEVKHACNVVGNSCFSRLRIDVL